MIVEFSELASAGLSKIFQEEDKREDYRLSIVFFLKARDAERKAFPIDAFPDKQMYLRYLDEIRVMYELVAFGKPTIVWSIRQVKLA